MPVLRTAPEVCTIAGYSRESSFLGPLTSDHRWVCKGTFESLAQGCPARCTPAATDTKYEVRPHDAIKACAFRAANRTLIDRNNADVLFHGHRRRLVDPDKVTRHPSIMVRTAVDQI